MSDVKPEERSWPLEEGDTAMVELKQGIQRVKEHFELFRAATAPSQPANDSDAS